MELCFLQFKTQIFFPIDEEMEYTSNLKMLQNQRFTADKILTQVAE